MVVSALADLSGPRIAVIGCGNPNRGDDGAGPRVVALLAERGVPDDVALYDAGTDGMAVLYRARGAKALVIVDARAPGGEPGAVYEVPGEALEAAPPHSLNLHDFRWDHALAAGRAIHGAAFPPARVFLIEAQSLDLGLTLSPKVTAAVEHVCERIAQMVAAPKASVA